MPNATLPRNESPPCGGSLELLDDAFRLLVVWGDPTSNEALRSRQAAEQIDGDGAPGSFQQVTPSVRPRS